jgi:hypothetical protein
MDDADREAFWSTVQETLVEIYQLSDKESKQAIEDLKGRLATAPRGISTDVIFHSEPFAVASDLAGQRVDLASHRFKYETIVRRNQELLETVRESKLSRDAGGYELSVSGTMPERFKLFTAYFASLALDALFVAAWFATQWVISILLVRAPIGLLDESVTTTFQLVFAIATLVPVIGYVVVDSLLVLAASMRRVRHGGALTGAESSSVAHAGIRQRFRVLRGA